MAKISVRDLSALPEVEGLRRLLQSLAMLDAILCEDWDSRYYSFDYRWGKKQMLGSMRNGSGDEFFAVFTKAGCLLKGFAHEARMSPNNSDPAAVAAGVLGDVPSEFSRLLNEPSLDMENTTFCIWRKHDDQQWHRGDVKFPEGGDPDGSEELLSILDGQPESYAAWAEEYYGDDWEEGRKLQMADVARIYNHEPLTKELVAALNSERQFNDVRRDAEQIGYPIAR